MRKMLSESILDLGKCPNRKMHESESAGFLDGALPESSFLIKSCEITTLNLFCEAFRLKKIKFKKYDFQLYFQKVI